VLYPARSFRVRFAPAGLALRRHGRDKIEERRSPPAHAARALQFTPAGVAESPHDALSTGTMAKSSAAHGTTSAAVRHRVSVGASPPLLRPAGQANGATPKGSSRPSTLRHASDDGTQATATLPKRFHTASSAVQARDRRRARFCAETLCSSGFGCTERAGFEPAMEFNPHTRLAGECLQPLGHLSWRSDEPV
jgi:hypothetical protein